MSSPLFAQAAETSAAILQWGPPGAIILVQFAAIVWLTLRLLESKDANTRQAEGATAKILEQRDASSARVDAQGAHVSRMAEAVEAQTKVLAEVRDASIRQTTAIDQQTQQITKVVTTALERRTASSQTTQAVKP